MPFHESYKFPYDTDPVVRIDGYDDDVFTGYADIASQIQSKGRDRNKSIVVVESYPGVRNEEIIAGLFPVLRPVKVVRAEEAALDADVIHALITRYLTDDRVFGYLAPFEIEELLHAERVNAFQSEIDKIQQGTVLVIGFGASAITTGDVLVYADLARWEIQKRYRSHELGNWQADNLEEDILRKYKRGYFFEWRVADRLKRKRLQDADFYLDTHIANQPKMITGKALMDGLEQVSRQPFRLVPYFDPGVWGGHWLEQHIDLPQQERPYAWGFDGVPEENSLYFQYGDCCIELPSINLVHHFPRQLLGDQVYARFGAEFPIRFDFLDTVGGQNLSLQVHPSTDYIQQTFGMHYTQDESYYILDAKPGATVYLGLKEDIDHEQMMTDLERAQAGDFSFPAEQYVNQFPASKHDHFSIPAGTIHSSGKDCMVLEISATPYIFTFKLWDWDRLGLDGQPRPVHLKHGFKNIAWDRTTAWVKMNLVGRTEQTATGKGWREERTGLHEWEFIETRRHWFSEPVVHETQGSVNVLNLVEGEEAVVESQDGAFDPFVVHYAETFIVPACVKTYTVRPSGPSLGQTIATIKAYVR